MCKRAWIRWIAALLAVLGCQTPQAGAQSEGGAAAEQAADVNAALQAVVEAFNGHDASKLAALWKADGVHHGKSTGATLSGRAAIQAAYAKLFAADPECKLALRTASLRQVAPAVASLDLAATVRHTDGSTTESELAAILVRTDQGWLIDEVREADVPAASEGNPLESLAWLVGDWTDVDRAAGVSSAVQWAPGGHFLFRSFRHEQDGKAGAEGLEILGWDAAAGQIRCWLFSNDGSFAHGVWQPEGPDQWLVKLAGQMPDGSRGSMTQVLKRTGTDRLTLQTIDRDWEGAPLPNGSVATLVRRASSGATTQSPPAKTPSSSEVK